MSKKVYFQNKYEDFTLHTGAKFLNELKNGPTGSFQENIKQFSLSNLQLLNTEMKRDIFSDYSVYTGSAGLALYYLTIGIRNELKIDCLLSALKYIDLNALKGRRISFLCGDAGPLALATVISYKLGSSRPDVLSDYKTLAERLMSLITLLNSSPDELLYGKCGYLYALLFVHKYIDKKDIIPVTHIEKVIASILNSGKKLSVQMKCESPLLWQWHDKIYYGAAHGMAGILYLLLQSHLYINPNEMQNLIKPTIDWLLDQRFKSGNFPSSMGSSSGDKLVQWCHGAPGFVPLCILAAEVFQEENYMKIAHEACDVIWQRGLCTKGYSICHGVSGNAYAFIQMYQATKEPIHLYRACCFMDWCLKEQDGTELHPPDRPASLFEGLVGRLYLAEDIINITTAKFPAFTI